MSRSKRHASRAEAQRRPTDETLAENPVTLLKRRAFTWLNARFGVGMAAVIVLGVLAWSSWDTIQKLPGIGWVMVRIRELQPLPHADGKRFAVAVARLENDDGSNSHRRPLIEALARQESVEVLVIDRELAIEQSAKPQEAVRAAHERARELLAQTGADVMIWGAALADADVRSPLSLHWTTAANVKLKKAVENYTPTESFELPELFWTQLQDVVGLLVNAQQAAIDDQRYRADHLPPFIARLSSLLELPSMPVEERARLRVILAQAHLIYGYDKADGPSIRKAVELYRQALEERPRERFPMPWAATQHSLAAALITMHVYEPDDKARAHLRESVAAFRLALEERTRERVPRDWAATQDGLGDALTELGVSEPGTSTLEAAVAAYRLALQVRTREAVPFAWAATQDALGYALDKLNEREDGTEHFIAAIAAYRSALEVRTRDLAPRAWAGTQSRLGHALWRLGQREDGTTHLNEAVDAYRLALEVYTREQLPGEWAGTQLYLAVTLETLGERETGTATLEESVAAHRLALEVYTRERSPHNWAAEQNNMGLALEVLGRREEGTDHLEQAVTAYRLCLMEWKREHVPYDWAMAQRNLARALQELGVRQEGIATLQQAVTERRAMLDYYPPSSYDLGHAQYNLAKTLWTIGRRSHDRRALLEAKNALAAARTIFIDDRKDLDWQATLDKGSVSIESALHNRNDTGSGWTEAVLR